jgi:hypothetical protein
MGQHGINTARRKSEHKREIEWVGVTPWGKWVSWVFMAMVKQALQLHNTSKGVISWSAISDNLNVPYHDPLILASFEIAHPFPYHSQNTIFGRRQVE